VAHHGAGCRRQSRHTGCGAWPAPAGSTAEEIKKQHGHAVRGEVGADEYFSIRPFGEEHAVQINRQDLAHIIEARVEEIFRLTLQEIKRSGYDGLLPAGMVLTGGTSSLPGIKRIASEVLGLPVRTAEPKNLVGLVDRLNSPAYSTSVGLLRWALTMHAHTMTPGPRGLKGEKRMDFSFVKKCSTGYYHSSGNSAHETGIIYSKEEQMDSTKKQPSS